MTTRLAQVTAIGALCGASLLGGSVALANDDPTSHADVKSATEQRSDTESALTAKLDAKLTALDERLVAVDARLAELDERLAGLDEQAAAAAALVAQLDGLMQRLEAAIAAAEAPKPAPAPEVKPEEAKPAVEGQRHFAGDRDGCKDGDAEGAWDGRRGDWDGRDGDRDGREGGHHKRGH